MIVSVPKYKPSSFPVNLTLTNVRQVFDIICQLCLLKGILT